MRVCSQQPPTACQMHAAQCQPLTGDSAGGARSAAHLTTELSAPLPPNVFLLCAASTTHRGQSVLMQHKLVHQILKADIEKWHGLTLITSSP